MIDKYNNSPHRGIQKYTPYQVYREGQMLDTIPEKPNAKNYKTKERNIVEYIKSEFPNLNWIEDKIIQNGCSRRRPD